MVVAFLELYPGSNLTAAESPTVAAASSVAVPRCRMATAQRQPSEDRTRGDARGAPIRHTTPQARERPRPAVPVRLAFPGARQQAQEDVAATRAQVGRVVRPSSSAEGGNTAAPAR